MNNRIIPTALIVMISTMCFIGCNNTGYIRKTPIAKFDPATPWSGHRLLNTSGDVYFFTLGDTVSRSRYFAFFPDGAFLDNGTPLAMNGGENWGIYTVDGDTVYAQIFYTVSGYPDSKLIRYWDHETYKILIKSDTSILVINRNLPRRTIPFGYTYEITKMPYPIKFPDKYDMRRQSWMWKDKKEWKKWKKEHK